MHLFSHAPAEEQHLWVVSVLRGEISKRLVSVMARLPCALGFVDSEDSDMTLMSLCVTRRKLQTPGNAEEHKRQETPTINPVGPTDKPHRPSTKHYRKDSPGDA